MSNTRKGYQHPSFHFFAERDALQEYSGVHSSRSESSEEAQLLRPRYEQKQNASTACGYNCVDSFDEDSLNAASDFYAFIQSLHEKCAAESESESGSEADSLLEEDELAERLDAVIQQHPAHAFLAKAAAFRAGIYELKGFFAYDQGFDRFFKQVDVIDTTDLPEPVAIFIRDCEIYSSQYKSHPPSLK